MSKYIIAHLVICSLYFIIKRFSSKDDAIYKIVLAFCIPVFGLLFFLFLDILLRIENKNQLITGFNEKNEDSIYENKFNRLNVEKEINIVPFEEALLINEDKIKREFIIDLIKNNPKENISILKDALLNKDTETSHYAAIALADIKNQFNIELMDISLKYETSKNDVDILISYVDLLKIYIESDLLDEKSREKYTNIYAQRLADLLLIYKDEPEYFIDKIDIELHMGNYTVAKEYCSKFKENHKNNEEVYIMFMKLYYYTKDKDDFYSTLEDLKNSPIKISNKVLNITRFWGKGEA